MTNDIITKDEAIDRMKAGRPCETFVTAWQTNCGEGWRATHWADFDAVLEPKFRKPPEPQRVAQEFWVINGRAFTWKVNDAIHVREVLPGDVTLARITEAKHKQLWDNDYSCGDEDWAGWHACAKHFGLIGEGS